MGIRVFSYGGGWQSTAALVLVAQGDLEADALVFANVGNDSENPGTLAYMDEIARPYARRHGVNLVEVQRKRRTGELNTVYQQMTRPGSRSIGIPVRMNGSGAPGRRACTNDFKIEPVARWCKRHGATPEDPAVTMLGITTDEPLRMRSSSGIPYTRLAYPLYDMGLSRKDCANIITGAGLPLPPKSSCWFCPYHSLRVWADMRHQQPDLFQRAVDLEEQINERRALLGKDPVWLTRKLKPLARAVPEQEQLRLWDDTELDNCESGYCLV